MFGKKTGSNLPVPTEQNSSQSKKALADTGAQALETLKFREQALFSGNVASLADRMTQQAATPRYAAFTESKLETGEYLRAKRQLTEIVLEKIDFGALESLGAEQKKERVRHVVEALIASDVTVPLTAAQLQLLAEQVVDDLLGFGPLEVLMADPEVADIMINGHRQVYIERNGKIILTDVTFNSEKHLLSVIQKIVSLVGRRIDESSPMVDARMPDGSRFNAIIPPLALDGCLVSIRKFRKRKMPLSDYVELGSMSESMCAFLSICGAIRLNIVISGGTGSGKTTLLNAISGAIDPDERIVTIEDAAELQLQQPHVLRLETRPANMEGAGEVGQRQLVRNALRMRPDRIILGEVRGDEIIDVLTAMNTGHDGSMVTIHANSPRDALTRIENLVGMSQVKLSPASVRAQIAGAVQLVVQIARMRDGKRRVVQIEEIVGMDGENIVMRTLFGYRPGEMDERGLLHGQYYCPGVAPHFLAQAAYFGREREMLDALGKAE